MDTQLSDIIKDLLRQMEALLEQPSQPALETLYTTAQRLEESTEKNSPYPGLNNAAFSFSVFLSTFSGRSNLPDRRQLEKLRKLSQDIGDYLKKSDHASAQYNTLLYFGDPELLPFGIHDLCAERRIRLSLIDDVFSLTHALENATALDLLVDLRSGNKLQPFLDAFARRAEASPITLSVVSIEDDVDSRMEAERLGAERFFTVPLIASELLNTLFPERGTTAPPPSTSRSTPNALPGVIVVDDDESQAEFAAAILANAGMRTLAISDPAKVLAMADEFVPDLILIDLYMPDISGEELTVMLRGKLDYRDIPLIYLSGELEKDKQEAALAAGANGFLEKPIRPKKLIKTVKEALKSQADTSAPRDEAASPGPEQNILEQMARHTSEQRERQPGLLSLALHVELDGDTRVEPGVIDKLISSLNTRLRNRGLLLPAGDNILRGVIHGKDIEGIVLIANNLHGILLAAFGPTRQVPTTKVAKSGLHLIEDPSDTRVWEYAASASQTGNGHRCMLHADTRQRLMEEQLERLNRHVLSRKPVDIHLREIRQADSHAVCAYLADASFPETRQWQGVSVAYAGLPAKSRLQLDRDLFSSALDRIRLLHRSSLGAHLLVPQSARVIDASDQPAWLRDALRLKQQVGSGMVCLFPIAALNRNLQQSRAYLDTLKDAGIAASAFDVGLHASVFQIADYLNLRQLVLSPKSLQEDVFKIKSFFDLGRNSEIQLVLPHADNNAALSQLVGADCYITGKHLDIGQ